MLRKWIMKIFGFVDKTEFDKLKLQLEDSGKKCGSRLAEADDLIESARKAIADARRVNFTTIDSYDVESEPYLLALKEIVENKAFIFFIHLHTMAVVAEITDGIPEEAAKGQGILKGIDYIMRNLHSARNKYETITEQREIK
jgi:hypothetical protein